jgi:uncharacterized protein YlaI
VIIFGTTGRLTLLAVVTFVCANCNTAAAQRVIERATKFSLFFIPLFTLGRSYYVECSHCGRTTRIDRAQADRYVAFSANNPVAEPRPSTEPRPSAPIDMGHLDAKRVSDDSSR